MFPLEVWKFKWTLVSVAKCQGRGSVGIAPHSLGTEAE